MNSKEAALLKPDQRIRFTQNKLAVKPETFKSQLLKAGEQLRQARLIHKAIKQ